MASSTCPACGASAFVTTAGDEGTCTRCGYASGESNRCPHCRAIARVEGTGIDRVCAVCGGPRIPGGFGGEAATNALREQRRALANAKVASIATVIQAAFAVLGTLLGLALLPEAIAGKILVFAIALVPLVLALRSRSRANDARAAAKDAAERAWQAAAEDATAHRPEGITAAALGEALGVEQMYADKLLTSLAVHDRARVDVGDDAEVRYSVPPGAQVRVAPALSDEEAAEAELLSDVPQKEREGRVR